ncbi:GDP-Man:Man(3)GlcNAc(2)-PP-Dol alpha-1,2-mannosyltransferase [Grifola frondosa]|uniref:GDP-Man:Man(3)GlcNAc(2)-PP-Dol alpha-1,2-mannosyltransferase n=1 Tax=Grifola frondosa TaxID=5627 RepID=A0A1C7M2P8_GRIFR|nr:GDP-Man:Man(3)GlcNAc(2)-PP-Dol alpha-1,2-mannosyltransferase [Grifola frondosa]
MLTMIIFLVFLVVLFFVSNLVARVLGLRQKKQAQREALLKELGIQDSQNKKRIVGFFHPYCNAGGGGERVLWTAIAIIQRHEPDIVSIVYSGDVDATKAQIIAKVKARFDIHLSPQTLHFVFLRSRHLVEDSSWPRFTLLGQSIGSMYLAWEAMSKLIPDLFIDTMGYAFTFHIVSLLGNIPIGAYVHYPTISTNMVDRVQSRKTWHTNSDAISSSSILSRGKLLYYRLFMYYYAYSLRQASFLMVNSSWTKSHIDAILQHTDPLLDAIHLLTPLGALKILSLWRSVDAPKSARIRVILSVAQFRPEKDHPTQLRSFKELLKSHPEYGRQGGSEVKLVLLGGCRGAEDAARVEGLRSLAKALDIEEHVQFVVNAPYQEVLEWLSKASIGLSTMVDEHFGINVVEFMAAGLIPVTHASGGPLNDIVVPFNGEPTGYHATSPETFAEALHTALTLSPEAELALRLRARTWAVQRFSEEEFEKEWDASGWKKWLRA